MSVRRGVLLLLDGPHEVDLVRALDAPGTGLTVTRRCADVAELLAAAHAGAGQVAVLDARRPGVDVPLLARLTADRVRTVVLAAPTDHAHWRAAHEAVPAEAGPARIMAAVVAALAAPDRTPRPGAPATATGTVDPGGTANPWVTTAVPDGGAADALPPWHPAAPGGPLDPALTLDATADAPGSGACPPAPSSPTPPPAPPPSSPSPASASPAPGPPSGPAVASAARHPRHAAGSTSTAEAAPRPSSTTDRAPAPPGRLVVVWGTAGAPGRTTVAINLAAELADLAAPGRAARRRRPRPRGPVLPGRRDPARRPSGPAPVDTAGTPAPILLVDADTEAPSVAQALAVLDDASSVAALARRAAHGRLTPTGVRHLSPVLRPGLHVATGLSRPDRWRELPAAAMDDVWVQARRAARVTVVDVGPGAEEPPPGLEGWGAPVRHGVTLSALAAADTVLVVGAADPIGIRRLVQALTELRERELAPDAAVVPVVTRVRASVTGAEPERAVLGALARYADVAEATLVPDDRPGTDRCLLEGRTLAEVVPRSPARAAIAALAAMLLRESVGVRR